MPSRPPSRPPYCPPYCPLWPLRFLLLLLPRLPRPRGTRRCHRWQVRYDNPSQDAGGYLHYLHYCCYCRCRCCCWTHGARAQMTPCPALSPGTHGGCGAASVPVGTRRRRRGVSSRCGSPRSGAGATTGAAVRRPRFGSDSYTQTRCEGPCGAPRRRPHPVARQR